MATTASASWSGCTHLMESPSKAVGPAKSPRAATAARDWRARRTRDPAATMAAPHDLHSRDHHLFSHCRGGYSNCSSQQQQRHQHQQQQQQQKERRLLQQQVQWRQDRCVPTVSPKTLRLDDTEMAEATALVPMSEARGPRSCVATTKKDGRKLSRSTGEPHRKPGAGRGDVRSPPCSAGMPCDGEAARVGCADGSGGSGHQPSARPLRAADAAMWAPADGAAVGWATGGRGDVDPACWKPAADPAPQTRTPPSSGGYFSPMSSPGPSPLTLPTSSSRSLTPTLSPALYLTRSWPTLETVSPNSPPATATAQQRSQELLHPVARPMVVIEFPQPPRLPLTLGRLCRAAHYRDHERSFDDVSLGSSCACGAATGGEPSGEWAHRTSRCESPPPGRDTLAADAAEASELPATRPLCVSPIAPLPLSCFAGSQDAAPRVGSAVPLMDHVEAPKFPSGRPRACLREPRDEAEAALSMLAMERLERHRGMRTALFAAMKALASEAPALAPDLEFCRPSSDAADPADGFAVSAAGEGHGPRMEA